MRLNFWPFSRKSGASSSLDLFRELYGWRETISGATVNHKNAVEVMTVLACARVLSEGVAQVPCKLLKETGDGRSRLPAKDHPLYLLLHRKPNPWMTSFELRETMMIHAALTGDAIAVTPRMPGTGRILSIIPIRPEHVEIKQNEDYSLTYTITSPDGSKRKEVPSSMIWHWRGPSWDGVCGMDTVKLAREAIGLSMVMESSHAAFHKNNARIGGVYSVEGTLNPDQHDAIVKWISEYYAGAGKTGLPMVLDRGAKFNPQTMTGVDAQHLESRKHQIEEVCRAFRVMPIMVGHADKTATYASAEQMFLAHVVHTLSPWYERIEQSADCQLLTDKEVADGYYIKFITAGLLRGALKDTAEFLVKLTTNGIMTRNEAREKLEYNPLEGLDEPLVSANTTQPEDDPAKEDDKGDGNNGTTRTTTE